MVNTPYILSPFPTDSTASSCRMIIPVLAVIITIILIVLVLKSIRPKKQATYENGNANSNGMLVQSNGTGNGNGNGSLPPVQPSIEGPCGLMNMPKGYTARTDTYVDHGTGPVGSLHHQSKPNTIPEAFQPQNNGINSMNLADGFGDKPFLNANPQGMNMGTGIIEGDETMFQQIVDIQKQPVIVAFMMSSCGFCKRIRPQLEQAAVRSLQNGRLPFMAIDVNKAGSLLQKYQIKGFPSIVKISNGQVTKYIGDRSENSLYDFAQS